MNQKLEPESYNSQLDNANSVFKKRIGGFLSADLYLSKNLKNSMEAFIEPGINYYLNSFTADAYPLKQFYLSPSIKFGIKIPILY